MEVGIGEAGAGCAVRAPGIEPSGIADAVAFALWTAGAAAEEIQALGADRRARDLIDLHPDDPMPLL